MVRWVTSRSTGSSPSGRSSRWPRRTLLPAGTTSSWSPSPPAEPRRSPASPGRAIAARTRLPRGLGVPDKVALGGCNTAARRSPGNWWSV